jgi:hypothetical protein
MNIAQKCKSYTSSQQLAECLCFCILVGAIPPAAALLGTINYYELSKVAC